MQNSYRFQSLLGAAIFVMFFCPGPAATFAAGQTSSVPPAATATAVPSAPGVPLTADQLTALLPPSVYFQGRSAPLQLRNAGGTSFEENRIVWAALVDSSGYSSSIQEKYQFYLVTEGPLRVGGVSLAAGAYGGGFQGDHFLVMDLGGHAVAQGPVQTDAALQRPRPLRIMPEGPTAVRLYLGRRWIELQSVPKV